MKSLKPILFVMALLALAPFLRAEETKTEAAKVPNKIVVLTFDDSVASHATFVGPLLKKLGFGATFFITEGFEFAQDKEHYMSWEQIKALNDDGFEIGNHTKNHTAVKSQALPALSGDVEYIETQCAARGIPRPTSFCYPGYQTSDAAVKLLRERGYKFARAGGNSAFDPAKDEPLTMPQAFDSKPGCTLAQFASAVAGAKDGKIAVMTFHGVPDIKHPWVNTDPALFEKFMQHLKDEKCTVISVREMAKYLPAKP